MIKIACIIAFIIIIITLIYSIETKKYKVSKSTLPNVGKGCFATRDIKKGEIIGYLGDYSGKPAPPITNPGMEKDINKNVQDMVSDIHAIKGLDERLFKDLGDNYDFDLGMRNFYTMPNTTIPNDQAGFARFCYGDMISCKEGSDLACSQKNLRFRGN